MFVLLAPAFGQDLLNDFDVVLPQVAKGDLNDVAIQTTIVIVNPNNAGVTVELTSDKDSLLQNLTLELVSLERREIEVSGAGDLVTGAVRVRAKQPLSVSAVLVTRQAHGDQRIISRAAVLAQPLAASVVIPVFYRAAAIDNTGVALFLRELDFYRLELYDASGTLVDATVFFRQTSNSPAHYALFVDELFVVALPENFVGWIRLYGFDKQARGLAAMALYTAGAEIVNAESSPIDVPARYRLTLQSEGETLVKELQGQYGFEYHSASPPLPQNVWKIDATDEVARALERDPRVVSVEPSSSPSPLSN